MPTTDFVPTSYLYSPGGVLTVCIGLMLTELSWAKLDKQYRQYIVVFINNKYK